MVGTPGKGRLCGGPLLFPDLFRLQAVQVIRGALCMRGGAEDQPLVAMQCRQPGGYVGGVVLANLGRDLKIGTKERGA
jgi:hypothetical protein